MIPRLLWAIGLAAVLLYATLEIKPDESRNPDCRGDYYPPAPDGPGGRGVVGSTPQQRT